jgi:hypothetical protein
MGFLQAIGIVLATLLAMESISWAMHKFLFHGPLWFIHKSHHQERSGFFEWNDVFSLLFGTTALLLLVIDREQMGMLFWMCTGISLYGIIYLCSTIGLFITYLKVLKPLIVICWVFVEHIKYIINLPRKIPRKNLVC